MNPCTLMCLIVMAPLQDRTEYTTVVKTRSGQSRTVKLVEIDDKRIVAASTADSIPLQDVDQIQIQKIRDNFNGKSFDYEIIGTPDINIKANSLSLKDDQLEIDLTGTVDKGKTVAQSAVYSIPRKQVQSIKFNRNVDDKLWTDVQVRRKEGDCLVIERDGRLDIITGIIKSLSIESVGFETRGREVDVKTSRLAGILFFDSADNKQKPGVRVFDIFGNRFAGNSIKWKGKQVTLLVGSESSITLPASAIAMIDYSAGRFLSLADLAPQRQSWKPYLKVKIADSEMNRLLNNLNSIRSTWTKNNAFGERLALDCPDRKSTENPVGRIVFASGFAIQGGTTLVFELPQGTTDFTANAGIKSNPQKWGSVHLVFKVDGKEVYKKRITARDKDLTSVKFECKGERLTVEVDYAHDGDQGDLLILGNPRLGQIQ